jgi:hypothetical protein
MMLLELSDGHKAIVDMNVFDYLSQFKWTTKKQRNAVYAVRNQSMREASHGKRKTIYMHREVLEHLGVEIPHGHVVDHINKDGLDNRVANLRVIDKSQNAYNARKRTTKSGYIGVHYDARSGLYLAKLGTKTLGRYPDAKTAAIYRDRAALKETGDIAALNYPELKGWYLRDGEIPRHLL